MHIYIHVYTCIYVCMPRSSARRTNMSSKMKWVVQYKNLVYTSTYHNCSGNRGRLDQDRRHVAIFDRVDRQPATQNTPRNKVTILYQHR